MRTAIVGRQGVRHAGETLDSETCARLFSCAGRVVGQDGASGPALPHSLTANAQRHAAGTINGALEP